MNHTLRIVTPRYGPEIIGGSESLVRSMAHALVQRDWNISVWTSDAVDEASWSGGYTPLREDDQGVAVTRFPVQRTRNPERFALLSRVFFRLPQAARPEQMWLRMQGPYVPGLVKALHTSAPTPTLFTPYLFYPTLCGLPVSSHPRILMPAAHDERPFALRAVGKAFKSCDGLLFHTQEERELTHKRYPWTASLPSEVGSVGVKRIGREHVDAVTRYQPYIYFGGRATPGKGIETLLEGLGIARRTHPEVHLVVSGAAAEDPVFSGHENVDRLGVVSGEMRNQLLSGAIATVVPGALESLSMLALESWAAGTPCIVNGDSAVLKGQAQRSKGAITFDSSTRLAEAITTLLTDPKLAGELGAAGQRHVLETYQWDAVAERIVRLINS